MQVEFLEEGSADCPLIRIYGIDVSEFILFHHSILQLAGGVTGSCRVDEIAKVSSNCALTAMSSTNNFGIRRAQRDLVFDWVLTLEKWAVVAGLLEPFTLNPRLGAFQWLSGKEARYGLDSGEVSLVIINSDEGRW